MKTIIESATNKELLQFLRAPGTIIEISDADLRVVADRFAELLASPVANPRAKKRRMSRADRFSEAQGHASDALAEVQNLKEELESWRDNLPENLQSSNKADMLETAIGELETIEQSLEEVEGASVEFPGMFS